MKFSPLTKDAQGYVSLGEICYQYFYSVNEDWGETVNDKDGYILTRYLAHAAIYGGKYISGFVQLQSSLANGKLSASAIDDNPLDLHQASVAFKVPSMSGGDLLLRIGRQELSFGSQRLVSVRDGPNSRQAFDAVRSTFSMPSSRLDVFYIRF